jgi:hypothetical protein
MRGFDFRGERNRDGDGRGAGDFFSLTLSFWLTPDT